MFEKRTRHWLGKSLPSSLGEIQGLLVLRGEIADYGYWMEGLLRHTLASGSKKTMGIKRLQWIESGIYCISKVEYFTKEIKTAIPQA